MAREEQPRGSARVVAAGVAFAVALAVLIGAYLALLHDPKHAPRRASPDEPFDVADCPTVDEVELRGRPGRLFALTLASLPDDWSYCLPDRVLLTGELWFDDENRILVPSLPDGELFDGVAYWKPLEAGGLELVWPASMSFFHVVVRPDDRGRWVGFAEPVYDFIVPGHPPGRALAILEELPELRAK